MPFVSVHHMEGVFTEEQRHSLIRDITEAYVRIGGEGIRPNVTVVINEVADGSWGEGGGVKTIATIEAVRAERAAKS